MENIERSFLERTLDKEKQKEKEDFSKLEIVPERREENDYYSSLRRELREKQKGGVDIHFAKIDPDKLSKRALDIYEEYKKENLLLRKI